MSWTIEFLDEALSDLKKLDHSVATHVLKGIQRVSQNPVSVSQGGYGKPLGNKNGTDLTNLLKIKFKNLGIRVVYKIDSSHEIMKIIIIAMRADDLVYKIAEIRKNKHAL